MRNWTEYYTAFTREADKHLRPSLRSLPFHTYILDTNHSHDNEGDVYQLRFLDSTKGIIHAVNGIITRIELDDYACFSKKNGCYSETVGKALNQFIGRPLKESSLLKASY